MSSVSPCSRVISDPDAPQGRSRIRSASTIPPPQASENWMPDATSRTLPAEEAISEIVTLLARGYQRLLREEASQLIKLNDESSADGLAIQPEQSVHAPGGQRHAPPSATGESKQGEDA